MKSHRINTLLTANLKTIIYFCVKFSELIKNLENLRLILNKEVTNEENKFQIITKSHVLMLQQRVDTHIVKFLLNLKPKYFQTSTD